MTVMLGYIKQIVDNKIKHQYVRKTACTKVFAVVNYAEFVRVFKYRLLALYIAFSPAFW